jgi:hypothetical protein
MAAVHPPIVSVTDPRSGRAIYCVIVVEDSDAFLASPSLQMGARPRSYLACTAHRGVMVNQAIESDASSSKQTAGPSPKGLPPLLFRTSWRGNAAVVGALRALMRSRCVPKTRKHLLFKCRTTSSRLWNSCRTCDEQGGSLATSSRKAPSSLSARRFKISQQMNVTNINQRTRQAIEQLSTT